MLDLISQFLSAHWRLHGSNATAACLRENVLAVANGLGSVYRALPRAGDALGGCLVGKLTPPSSGREVLRGGAAGGAQAAPATLLLSRLWGFMGGSGGSGGAAGGSSSSAASRPAPGASTSPPLAALMHADALRGRLGSSPGFWVLHAMPHTSRALLRLLGYTLGRATPGGGGSQGGLEGRFEGGAVGEGAEEAGEAEEEGERRPQGGLRGRKLLSPAGAGGAPAALPAAGAGPVVNGALMQCFTDLESYYATATGQEVKPVHYEEIESFPAVVEREMDELRQCSVKDLTDAMVFEHLGVPETPEGWVNPYARDQWPLAPPTSGVAPPLAAARHSVLLDGRANCWVTGSTSNIAGDFLYRSVYLRQIVRLHQAFGRVRLHFFPPARARKKCTIFFFSHPTPPSPPSCSPPHLPCFPGQGADTLHRGPPLSPPSHLGRRVPLPVPSAHQCHLPP